VNIGPEKKIRGVDIEAKAVRQLFWYSLDNKAVATRRIPDTYKPKPNPYLNTNPNPTSLLCKDSHNGKDFPFESAVAITPIF